MPDQEPRDVCPHHSGIVTDLRAIHGALEKGNGAMSELEGQIGGLRGHVDDKLDTHRACLLAKMDELKDRLTGRPSWAVTILITVLCSLVVGLTAAMAGAIVKAALVKPSSGAAVAPPAHEPRPPGPDALAAGISRHRGAREAPE